MLPLVKKHAGKYLKDLQIGPFSCKKPSNEEHPGPPVGSELWT